VFLLTTTLYVVWTLLLLGVLAIIIHQVYNYAEYTAKQTAITSVNKDIAYRSWVSSHGGVYVKVDKRTPPNPYLANIKDRDFNVLGVEFTLMNPAYTLSQMMRDYSKLYGVKTKITSKLLLNPKNRADNWETLALDKIDQTQKQYMELSYIKNAEYMRLMSPLITTKSCLKCHAFQGYKVGDIRGGVSVAIPMAPLYKDAKNNAVLISFLFSIIWLVGLLSIALLSKKLYAYINEKETLYEEYVYGLVGVVEKRDTYTAGHSARVANYAEMIAKYMGYSEYDCHLTHRAGMLHDIGKIAIPDSVFLKPSKLSPNEYAIIQEHVEVSYDLLKNISIFDEIKEIVRDHHEHYDGNGYPRGLKGEDMPILAQILTLADAFDAMTTDRIYKGRKNIQEALSEIAKLSGRQFHPKIVQAALFALKNVTVEYTHHQNPETLLEQERFSYFYKDALTGTYNETCLQADLCTLAKYNLMVWISLKNFHRFNKKHGWSAGDKLLQELVESIKNHYDNKVRIYRFYGDNFIILFEDKEEVTALKNHLQTLLNKQSVAFQMKTSLLAQHDLQNIGSVEDVLKKLF
jgi:putative nucleotidyltransferase with HDIG domain/diguanylate cyclase (GGDEF)-like protein